MMIEAVTESMEKTIDTLRKENEQLKKENHRLNIELDAIKEHIYEKIDEMKAIWEY